jgi:epoxyqueuosine reductase QueG
MIDSGRVKQLAIDLGADLCGVAPVERFDLAPKGFHPKDLFPEARSAVVIAKRMPEGAFCCAGSAIPYSVATRAILMEVTRISCLLSAQIERLCDAVALPVPTEPYECWDEERREGRALLSFKHAGWLAGLGVLGKNTLLVNGRYGNRLGLGVVLIDAELEGDPIIASSFCSPACRLCLDTCPAGALNGTSVNQKLCRGRCEGKTKKNEPLYTCNACRKVCPNGTGVRVISESRHLH